MGLVSFFLDQNLEKSPLPPLSEAKSLWLSKCVCVCVCKCVCASV